MGALRRTVSALAMVLMAGSAGAQSSWPDRSIRVVVGFTPGSGTDVGGRIFAQKLSEALGVSVWVENVPGAGGNIGVDRVAKAAPDGYTLLFSGNGALTVSPGLYGKLPFDPERDFAPVSLVLAMPSILAVHNEVPAKSVQELVALARAQPGKLSFASPGMGTPQHIAGELFKSLAGVNNVHVPYRGAVITDVIGGRVTMIFGNTAALGPHVRDGKLRGLAVTSLQRSKNFPDLPSLAESGFPGFEATSWFGILAPAGTPPAIVRRLHAESVKILAEPELRERVAQLGMEPVGNAPDEFAAIIKSDIVKWTKVIKDFDVKPE
jgi:tripartite-type tricarboxylate transporter receptor subunit TctC